MRLGRARHPGARLFLGRSIWAEKDISEHHHVMELSKVPRPRGRSLNFAAGHPERLHPFGTTAWPPNKISRQFGAGAAAGRPPCIIELSSEQNCKACGNRLPTQVVGTWLQSRDVRASVVGLGRKVTNARLASPGGSPAPLWAAVCIIHCKPRFEGELYPAAVWQGFTDAATELCQLGAAAIDLRAQSTQFERSQQLHKQHTLHTKTLAATSVSASGGSDNSSELGYRCIMVNLVSDNSIAVPAEVFLQIARPRDWSENFFIAPWCSALRGNFSYGRLPNIGVFNQPNLQLYLYMSDDKLNREKKIQDMREALALLATVAHVDYAGWRFILERYCDLSLGEEGDAQYEEVIPAQFSLILNLKRNPISGRFDLVEFCGAQQLEHPTPAYVHALKKITDVGNIGMGQPPLDIKIPVQVTYPGCSQNDHLEMLLEVQKAEKIIRKGWHKLSRPQDLKSVAAGSIRCVFVLEPMNADIGIMMDISRTSKKVQKLIRENVWFSRVALTMEGSRVVDDKREYIRSFGNLVGSVFDRTRRRVQLDGTEINSSSLESLQHQIGEINLNCEPQLTSRDYEAMASAMVLNQTSEKASMILTMHPNDPDCRAQCWKWIAYAFFSKRSNQHSALRSLALMEISSLTVSEMEGFAAVLASDHPEEDAPIRWKFDVQGQPVESARVLAFPSSLPNLWTFSDDGSSLWVDVLVLGFGRCQVMRDELEFNSLSKADGEPGGLRSLRISFGQVYSSNPPRSGGLLLLLRAAGDSLKSLTLDRSVDINTVLQSCPNLEELSLWGGCVDAKFDFGDYHRQSLRLPVLTFSRENIPDLCESCGDGVIETNMKALLQMLAANRKLQYLELVVPPGNDKYCDRFRAYHHNPIQISLAPVSMKCKLAFLSVLGFGTAPTEAESKRKRVGSRSLSPGHQMAKHAVCKVLSFAAVPALRQVYFMACPASEYPAPCGSSTHRWTCPAEVVVHRAQNCTCPCRRVPATSSLPKRNAKQPSVPTPSQPPPPTSLQLPFGEASSTSFTPTPRTDTRTNSSGSPTLRHDTMSVTTLSHSLLAPKNAVMDALQMAPLVASTYVPTHGVSRNPSHVLKELFAPRACWRWRRPGTRGCRTAARRSTSGSGCRGPSSASGRRRSPARWASHAPWTCPRALYHNVPSQTTVEW
ncbi:hypothetical protein ON010_g11640 [Phytophthora cinnamomi]|nr:hypothetical protein ON010_g11640 [Phytophthora cinnamomi]